MGPSVVSNSLFIELLFSLFILSFSSRVPVSTTPAGTIQHVKPVSPTKNTVVRVPQVLLASIVKTVGDLKNSLEVF